MSAALLATIGGIVFEGLKIFSEERKHKFTNEHHEILEELENAKNKIYPNYTDAAVDIADERLRLFLEAYWSELRKANVEVLQS